MTVELWYALTGPLENASAQARLRARLTPDDLARLARAASPRHTDARVAAWVLARVVLSRHAEVPPEAWRFREGPHGRPELAGPAVVPRLHFNLSHTTGLVACVVASEHQVGVDVEHVWREVDLARLARRVLAPEEAASIAGAPEADRRRRRFFEHWTLKEAYLKACGAGLSRPLAAIAFALAPDGTPSASFGPAVADDPAAWQFFLVRPTPDHVAAVALGRPRARPARLVLRQAVPEVHLFASSP